VAIGVAGVIDGDVAREELIAVHGRRSSRDGQARSSIAFGFGCVYGLFLNWLGRLRGRRVLGDSRGGSGDGATIAIFGALLTAVY
jgi:hypothetical protein